MAEARIPMDQDLLDLEIEFQEQKEEILKDIDPKLPRRKIPKDMMSQITSAVDRINELIMPTVNQQNRTATREEITVGFRWK